MSTSSPKKNPTISFLPHSMLEQWFLAKNVEEYDIALAEVSDVYKSLSVQARQKSRNDVPKLLRLLQMNEFTSSNILTSILLFMGMLLRDHAEAFVSELHSLFPKIQEYMYNCDRNVRKEALKFTCTLVSRIPYHLTEHFVLTVLKNEHIVETDLPLKVAVLALLNTKVPREEENMSTLIAEYPIAMTSRIAKMAYLHFKDVVDIHASKSLTVAAAIDVCAAALLRSEPTKIGNLPDDDADSLVRSLLGDQQVTDHAAREIYHRASELFFPSLLNDPSTTSILVSVITAKKEVFPYSRQGSETNLSLAGVRSREILASPSEARLISVQSPTPQEVAKVDEKTPSPSSGMFKLDIQKMRSEHLKKLEQINSLTPEQLMDEKHPTFPSLSMAATLPVGGVHSEPRLDYTPSWEVQQSTQYDVPKNHPEKISRTPPTSGNHAVDYDFSKYVVSGISTLENGQKDANEDDFYIPVLSVTPSAAAFAKPRSTSIDNSSPWLADSSESQLEDDFDRAKLDSIKKGGGGRVRKTAPMRMTNIFDSPDAIDDIKEKPHPKSSIGVRHNKDKMHNNSTSTDIISKTPKSIGKYSVAGKRINTLVDPHMPSDMTSGTYGGEESSNVNSDKSSVHPIATPKRSTSFKSKDSPSTSKALKLPMLDGTVGDTDDVIVKSKRNSPVRPRQEKIHPNTPEMKGLTAMHKSLLHSPRNDQLEKALSTVDDEINQVKDPTAEEFKPDAMEYLMTEDITPLVNPTKDLNKVVSGLEIDEWPTIFHTINTLRSLALHHAQLVVSSGNLHSIITKLMKQIDSLRSSLAKNAILALGDLFLGLKKGMDPEVTHTARGLAKRYGDSSNFLGESAYNTFVSMIDNVSPQRSLAGLLSVTDSKSGEVRGRVVSLISYLLENKGIEVVGTKELVEGLLKSKLEKLLSDQNQFARYYARYIVELVLERRLVGSRSELEQYLSPSAIDKSIRERSKDKTRSDLFSPKAGTLSPISSGGSRSPMYKSKRPGRLEIMSSSTSVGVDDECENLSVEDSNDNPGSSSMGKLTASPVRYSARDVSSQNIAAKRELESVEELRALPEILRSLSTSNATERVEALTVLTDMIINFEQILKSAGKFESCIDNIIEKLDDSSVKVSMHSVSCLRNIQGSIPKCFSASQKVFIPALLNACSSSNKMLSNLADDLLEDYINANSLSQVISSLCSSARHEKDRSRVIAIKAISRHIPKIVGQSLTDARRTVFPIICDSIFSEPMKPEIKIAASEALRILQREVFTTCDGVDVTSWIEDSSKRAEIKKIIGGKSRSSSL